VGLAMVMRVVSVLSSIDIERSYSTISPAAQPPPWIYRKGDTAGGAGGGAR
jgi:hypothetical protein